MVVGEIAWGMGTFVVWVKEEREPPNETRQNNQGSRKECGRNGFLMLSREKVLRRRPGFVRPALLLMEGED